MLEKNFKKMQKRACILLPLVVSYLSFRTAGSFVERDEAGREQKEQRFCGFEKNRKNLKKGVDKAEELW